MPRLLDGPNRLYNLTRDDGLTAVIQFSEDGRHAVYLDEFFFFSVLQKDATGLAPSYSDADLGNDWWSGTVVRYGPETRQPGQHALFTVLSAREFMASAQVGGVWQQFADDFSVQQDQVPLVLGADPRAATIGFYTGDWKASEGADAGDVVVLLSPDKDFMAAKRCRGRGPVGIPNCEISGWIRAKGTYSATCTDSRGGLPPTLIANCRRIDGTINVDARILLPCLGSIENIDGELKCL